MHQISLGDLVQYVSPEKFHLLKYVERTKDIVLRHGLETVGEDDIVEIMEAVITEQSEEILLH
ncbi:hypothetical protein [Alkalicoccus chagannorensis]|uniref:hypothetical protein n=1 Tax=Alkalicoccus chagannorensis TaxID=427072 RepID=UPI0003FA7183|nr:hypothetical protein [Alkalicoccus chagannorensis]